MSQRYWHVAVLALMALPWLVYFSVGPTPVILQALVSAAVLGTLWLQIPPQNLHSDSDNLGSLFAQGWMLASGLSAIAGLIQYFDLASGMQPWISESSGVAFANLRQRNQFASLCLIGLCAGIGMSCTREKTAVAVPMQRVLSVSVMALLTAGVAASHSRTGVTGLLAIVAMTLLWREPMGATLRLQALAMIPLYVVLTWLMPVLAGQQGATWGALSRFAEEGAHCQSRVTLWSNVLHLIQQRPWLGWGWSELDYAHYANLYTGERFCAILDNAHNLPLHLAVELGVPMAAILCGGAAYAIWRQRPWAERDAMRQMAWMILSVIGLHSMLEYPLWYGPFQLTVLLCLVLLWRRPADNRVQDSHSRQLKRPFRLIGQHFIALIFGAFLLYVGWDYRRISQIYLSPQDRSAAYAENTLAKIQNSWLFKSQVQFAELAITPLTQANAAHHLQTALDVLHFSPEPRVIERLLDSALVLHRDDLLAFHMPRYRAAFPDSYAAWAQKTTPPQNSPTFPRASPASEHP